MLKKKRRFLTNTTISSREKNEYKCHIYKGPILYETHIFIALGKRKETILICILLIVIPTNGEMINYPNYPIIEQIKVNSDSLNR